MTKILTAKEVAQVVTRLLTGQEDWIGEASAYAQFLEDVGEAVAHQIGAEIGGAQSPMGDRLGWTLAFHRTEDTLEGGGILEHYDRDEDWR